MGEKDDLGWVSFSLVVDLLCLCFPLEPLCSLLIFDFLAALEVDGFENLSGDDQESSFRMLAGSLADIKEFGMVECFS